MEKRERERWNRMDSCSIDLVLGEEHFSGPYSVPLECHVASIQQPRGKGVLVGLYAHLQPTSHPQGFTGAKRLSFESASPFAKAFAVCARQLYDVCS